MILKRCEARYAPVAQLDRVTGYEPVGRGFESLPAYQKRGCPVGVLSFGLMTRRKGLEQSNLTARWAVVVGDGSLIDGNG